MKVAARDAMEGAPEAAHAPHQEGLAAGAKRKRSRQRSATNAAKEWLRQKGWTWRASNPAATSALIRRSSVHGFSRSESRAALRIATRSFPPRERRRRGPDPDRSAR